MFQMAERLGRTVRELEDTLSWRELLEWGAFDKMQALEALKRKSTSMHEGEHRRNLAARR